MLQVNDGNERRMVEKTKHQNLDGDREEEQSATYGTVILK